MLKKYIITAKNSISGVAIQPVYAFGQVATIEAAESFAETVANWQSGNWSVQDILFLNTLRDFRTGQID